MGGDGVCEADALTVEVRVGEALALAPAVSDGVLLAVLEAVMEGVAEGESNFPLMMTLSSRRVPPTSEAPLPTSRKAKPAALLQAGQLIAKEAENVKNTESAPVEKTVAGLVSSKFELSTLVCKLSIVGPVAE